MVAVASQGSCSDFVIAMDLTHLSLGLVCVVVGYLSRPSPAPAPVSERPCSCHCSCSSPEIHPSIGISWELIVFLSITFGSLCLAIGLLIRGSVSSYPTVVPDWVAGFKGKAGKGVVGAKRGLQILDG